MHLPILHRDAALVIVDKPAGLSVHRGDDVTPPFALQLVRDAIGQHVYPVHRLDRPTSGALAFALSSPHAATLQRAMEDGRVTKTYLALVKGEPRGSFVIDEPMTNDGGSTPVPAVTEVEHLFTTSHGWSLVRVAPRTGRRHQIRRHLKRRHHKLAGDVQYGEGKDNRALRERFALHRLALHASELALPHPETGEILTVHAPVPPDLRDPLLRMGVPEALLG